MLQRQILLLRLLLRLILEIEEELFVEYLRIMNKLIEPNEKLIHISPFSSLIENTDKIAQILFFPPPLNKVNVDLKFWKFIRFPNGVRTTLIGGGEGGTLITQLEVCQQFRPRTLTHHMILLVKAKLLSKWSNKKTSIKQTKTQTNQQRNKETSKQTKKKSKSEPRKPGKQLTRWWRCR